MKTLVTGGRTLEVVAVEEVAIEINVFFIDTSTFREAKRIQGMNEHMPYIRLRILSAQIVKAGQLQLDLCALYLCNSVETLRSVSVPYHHALHNEIRHYY